MRVLGKDPPSHDVGTGIEFRKGHRGFVPVTIGMVRAAALDASGGAAEDTDAAGGQFHLFRKPHDHTAG